ncbi:unnamed protein product [Brassicogethes aeneus]|uniref:Uncharacterized protein n=1 Tax=Brassicogethes aeneus TaxID=1431903 RepID=A0A9P0FIM8_BRAAE|nr:unnamed protein product [Brassicogethes aeneus]
MVAEKLYYPDSNKDFMKAQPMPFKTAMLGLTPQHFTTTTEKITTLDYPQLTNYRSKYYPKNIQDIIGYVNKDSQTKKVQEKQINQASHKEYYNISAYGSSFLNNDPFFRYKPQDPSDINLLATASFRFAPPVWSNFRRTTPKFLKTSPSNLQSVENTHEQYNMRKPLVVTLNIYPEKNDLGRLFHTFRKRNIPYKITLADSKKLKGKTMISLNLYPDSTHPSNKNNNNSYYIAMVRRRSIQNRYPVPGILVNINSSQPID